MLFKMKLFTVALIITTAVSAVPKAPQPTISNDYLNYIESTQTKPNPRLVEGRAVTPHSLSYQVLIYTENYYSGALISQNYVLAAATSVKGMDSVDIILGAHNRTVTEDTQVRMTSTEILIHPDFDDYIHFNLAIIRLPLSVRLGPAISPIPLPSEKDTDNDYTGTLATASNWRMTTSEGVDYFSDVLNDIQVNVISNTECSEVYEDITPEILCVRGASTTCTGDIGAPLVTAGVLIGVVGFVSTNCPIELVSGFTRVTSLLPWILENTDAEQTNVFNLD